jgi:hypothetical protein
MPRYRHIAPNMRPQATAAVAVGALLVVGFLYLRTPAVKQMATIQEATYQVADRRIHCLEVNKDPTSRKSE